MNNYLKILKNGIITENPAFVLLLGMCPALGTTHSALNGLGMGLATTFVLVCSNIAVSAVKNLIPDRVRVLAFIIIIATFVGILEMLMQAYTPALYSSLGIFVPLIVVNCIVLGRAEVYATQNSIANSMLDGLGMGLGFTAALTLLGIVRELLGTGQVFDLAIFPSSYGMLAFVLAPGAFIALAYLIVLIRKLDM